MFRHFRGVLTVFVTCCATILVPAQTPPCNAGTLANVLGTSCSVGRITFNFESQFFGNLSVFDHGAIVNSETIIPAEIGFTPISQGDEVGFKLTTNFLDGPGSDSSFGSVHLVQFSYEPQANPGSDMVEETIVLNATGHGDQINLAFADALDFQNYPNVGFTAVDAGFNTQLNATIPSLVEGHVNFQVPALSSLPGGGQITQLSSIADGTAKVTLGSATFLYRVGPEALPPQANLTYTNIDLSGTAGTFVSGITNAGTIAGSYQDTQGVFHGFLTDNRGGFRTIDFPNATATFPGVPNDRGDVVGVYTDIAGNTHGFLFADESFAGFDFPGAILTGAAAINDRRQIVGIYETADQGIHGFLFEDSVFTSIDRSPPDVVGGFTEAIGINNRSEIVGTFFDPLTLRGLVQQGGVFHPFDVPGQVNTVIEGVNDAGDFVGSYIDMNLVQHGFVSKDELFRTVDFPGGSNSISIGINGQGIIVGQYTDAAGNFHSFLAQPSTGGSDNGTPLDTALDRERITAPQSLTPRICGNAEWRQHPEQIRNSASCQIKH